MSDATVSASPRDLLVVPHTHWDREWYRPFESYRYRLVQTLDRVLDADLPFFLLDGQTVALDDYLAIRPEREATLKARIDAGSLGAGPWYVLVDEFLVSGESLVRNLLEGAADMRRFGARAEVGYLPDMFGHIAQMPQILSRFGLATAVVWRGANPGAPRFRWVAPDGTEVVTAWLPLGYYQPMFLEPQTPEARREQLGKYLEAFGAEGPAWFTSGADHMAPRTDLVAQLDALNRAEPGVKARIATLEEVLEGPRPDVAVAGELRDCSRAYILPGVLSARTYLKQANARCQTTLERYAEPLTALAWARGSAHPTPFLRHAWRELMKNHPHDSICGCSIDQVHREMMPRFDAVLQVADELMASAAGAYPKPQAAPAVTVFNPTGWTYAGWVELEVDWPLAEAPEQVALAGPDGARVPVAVLAVEDTEVFRAEIDLTPDWFPVRRFRLAARLVLPASACVRLQAVAEAPAPVARGVEAADDRLENEHLALRLVDGRLELHDKTTGEVYADCHYFLDEGDAGDEYNFSPLADDSPVRSVVAGSRVVSVAPHQAVWEVESHLIVPEGLSGDRSVRGGEPRTLVLKSRFRLEAGARVLAVETAFDNVARDHRLRVVTRYGAGTTPALWSEGAFGVFLRTPRQMTPLPVPKGTEAVMPEFPQMGFTALEGRARGLAVANVGLPEASLVGDETGWGLATTLLRAVGWLSRDDLRTRGGGAGPRFPTPEAQCLGPQVFQYALAPYTGSWEQVLPRIHQFLAPPRAWQGEGPSGPVLDLGDGRVVLSALKKAEGAERLVLRVYNTTPEPIEATLTLHLPHRRLWEADLAERAGAELGRGAIGYRLGAYEIRTWLVELER